MSTYNGPATLFVGVHKLELTLRAVTADRNGGLSWSGTLSATAIPNDVKNAREARIRVSRREVACRIVSSATRQGRGQVSFTIEVAGDYPPFSQEPSDH